MQDVVSELRYIDKIIPDPFLFEGLYEAKVLNADETHCFLFLDDDDAFLALYNEGKFGFTRGFSMYSLTNLCEQYKYYFCSKRKEGFIRKADHCDG